MIAFALFCAGCDEGSGTQPGREAMNVENPSIHIHAASHTPFDEIREARHCIESRERARRGC